MAEKIKVLLVDDEEIFCKNLEKFLHMKDYESHAVHNGMAAVEYVEKEKPVIILLDIRMPGIDGIETLKRIKKLDVECWVIILTAFDDVDYAISAINEGAYAFLRKPINLLELNIFMEAILEKRSLIIENREHLKNLKEMYLYIKKSNLEIVRALADAIEAKDPYTRGHCNRVTIFSRQLGKEIGLPEAKLEIIEYGALLHDVGKIGVRDSVLNKKNKLNDVEFEHIQKHPEIGMNILGNIDFLKEAMRIVKQHHERFDGEGYPEHLKETQIDITSQIVMIADAYDAMTSDRSYRKGMPRERALAILKEFKGTQFNPELVDVFIEKELYLIDE